MSAGFAALSLLIIAAAFWVVTLKDLFRAALSLGLVLIGVAIAFLSLGAEFLAFVQILVYVGAHLTLIGLRGHAYYAKLQTGPEQASRPRLPAALAALAVFGLLTWATYSVPLAGHAAKPSPLIWPALGQQLVTNWFCPLKWFP